MNETALTSTGASVSCRNCEAPLVAAFAYCPQCGQKVDAHRLTLARIGDDVVHAFLHVDHSILALLRGLLLRPGHLARDYIEGRRKRYFGPFAFVGVTAGLVTFFVTLTGAQWFKPVTDSHAQEILTRHISLVILLQTPVLTALCLMLFWKNRLNYAEHMALVAYTAGIRMLYLSFVAAPVMYFTQRSSADPAFVVGYYVPWLAYFAVAAVQFYGGKPWVTVLKAVVAGIVNQLLTGVGIYIFIYTYERMTH